jgi:hypothetical protein
MLKEENKMRIKRVIVYAALILMLSSIILLWAENTNLGSFNLPRDITYEGKTITKGTYDLELEIAAEDAYLLIKKDNEVVCREMAIIMPAKQNYASPKITVVVLAKDDDPILRIRVFVGNKIYSTYYQYI